MKGVIGRDDVDGGGHFAGRSHYGVGLKKRLEGAQGLGDAYQRILTGR